MKNLIVFAGIIFTSFCAFSGRAQDNAQSFIPSSHLAITCNKTTNLIFPYSVQSIDRGSKDVLVQQPKGTENIVQLKADRPDFMQTNLSVITVNGSLYSFTVDYAVQPSQLNIVVKDKDQTSIDSSEKQAVQLSSGNNEALYKTIAQKISESKIVRGKRFSHNQIQLGVCGIYINNDIIYFRVQVKNKSNISYDIDNIRFSIQDSHQTSRTATQELELTPVYTYNPISKVPAGSSAYCIIALPKFTLPDSRYLSVEVSETGGSRDLHVNLKSHHLAHAKNLTDQGDSY